MLIRETLRAGVPNRVGSATVFVMRWTSESVRLGVETPAGTLPSRTYQMGDEVCVDGRLWRLAPGTPAALLSEGPPGTDSGRVVAFLDAMPST